MVSSKGNVDGARRETLTAGRASPEVVRVRLS